LGFQIQEQTGEPAQAQSDEGSAPDRYSCNGVEQDKFKSHSCGGSRNQSVEGEVTSLDEAMRVVEMRQNVIEHSMAFLRLFPGGDVMDTIRCQLAHNDSSLTAGIAGSTELMNPHSCPLPEIEMETAAFGIPEPASSQGKIPLRRFKPGC